MSKKKSKSATANLRAAEVRAQGFVIPSPEEVAAAATRPETGREAWTAAQLAEWGIMWPPRAGWRYELERAHRGLAPLDPDYWRPAEPRKHTPGRDAAMRAYRQGGALDAEYRSGLQNASRG